MPSPTPAFSPSTSPPGHRDTRDLLRAELERRWPGDGATLDRLARHALLPAGKLLRPLLLLESARAVGGSAEPLLPAALGVEYLHVGSLVHDDVIDGDALRRGRPTVAAGHGSAQAVVAGDALILGAFAVLAECGELGLPAAPLLETVRVLARAGLDLCHGQLAEAELCGDIDCGTDRYLRMCALKTGALFRGACRAGAVLGGGSPAQQAALGRYAEHLGLAFQLHDDLLPYVADAAVTGKPALSDLANRRPTFPLLSGYRLAGPDGREVLRRALEGAVPAREAFGPVAAVLAETGALEAAAGRALLEARRAKDALVSLPGADPAGVLAGAADLAVERLR